MLKNIVTGIGSVLALSPTLSYGHYRSIDNLVGRSDIEALRSDVEAIGRDFHKAADIGRQHVKAKKAR